MAPITAIQFGAHRAIEKAVTTATGRPIEGLQGIGVAIGAPELLCQTMRHICTVRVGIDKPPEQHMLRQRGPCLSQAWHAAGAGAASAVVGCPAELVMIQQQRTGRSLSAEVGTILRERGLLKFYRGLVRLPSSA